MTQRTLPATSHATAAGLMAVLAVAALSVGCMRTYETEVIEVLAESARPRNLKPATNLPSTFIVVIPATTTGGCAARLRDAGLNATLTLVQAVSMPQSDSAGTAYSWYGDYVASPVGAYGEVEGEGLRIDCTRLRPLGVVRLTDG